MHIKKYRSPGAILHKCTCSDVRTLLSWTCSDTVLYRSTGAILHMCICTLQSCTTLSLCTYTYAELYMYRSTGTIYISVHSQLNTHVHGYCTVHLQWYRYRTGHLACTVYTSAHWKCTDCSNINAALVYMWFLLYIKRWYGTGYIIYIICGGLLSLLTVFFLFRIVHFQTLYIYII